MRTARDEGNTHVLEAVIIASIMVSAVAFVVTFETPPTGTDNARSTLQTKADDALKILYDTPYPGSTMGDNALSVFLAQCMQGNCTNLQSKLQKLLPPGGAYAIYISNGYETYPVYIQDSPTGEAVTATHLLEPNWSSSFVATTRNNVNPAADSLSVYSMPVFNSNIVSMDGSPLLVKMSGTRKSDGSSFVLTTYAATEQVAAVDAQKTPAVSLNFLVPQRDGSGQIVSWVPGAAGDWTRETYNSGSQTPTLQNATFILQVNESANVDVLAGTELTINLPRGWAGSANQSLQNGDWLVLSNASDRNGTAISSDIKARLLNNVKNRHTNFTFNATYYGDLLNYYPFEARLSKGVYASAELIVKADERAPETQTFRNPAVRISAPSPMGASATTTWSLSVDIPFISGTNVNVKKGAANPASTYVTIEKIEIIELNGKKIFPTTVTTTHRGTDGVTTNGSTGTWTSTGEIITWKPSSTLTSQNGPISLTFRMAGNNTASSAAMRGEFVPPVAYNGMTGRLLSLGSPAFHRGEGLPATSSYGGYDPAVGANYSVRSDAVYRSTALLGGWKYNTSTIPSIGGALYGSYVQVDKRSVPIGGQVVLTSDVQSVLFALADVGSKTNVSVKFYPPWAGDSRTPIWQSSSLDTGLFATEVVTMTALDLNGDGWPDPVMGTSNGRVIAVDGISGNRISGLTYIAPLGANAPQGTTVVQITALEPLWIGGQKYIVVGTNEASGVHVLDQNFTRVWSYDKTPKETLIVNASADIDGDGRNDVVMVARDSNSQTFGVFVLRALVGQSGLQPWVPVSTVMPDAFYVSSGTPGAVVGLPGIGPTNTVGGVSVSVRTLPGQKQYFQLASGSPTQAPINTKVTIETPRYGLAGVARDGTESWVSFGSPISAIERYNHDNDTGTDLVAGSPNGYVYMMNGTLAGNQAFSTVPISPGPQLSVIDADGPDLLHQAYLTIDGGVFYTDDGWNAMMAMTADPILGSLTYYNDANGIAMNGTASMWLAGRASSIWYTKNPVPPVEDPNYPYMAKMTTITATKTDETTGLPIAFDFTTKIHDFNDIECGYGATGNECWVVGPPCLLLSPCNESLVMRTTNNGATWTVLAGKDNVLRDADTTYVSSNLSRIRFFGPQDEYGWIVGDEGVVLRSTGGIGSPSVSFRGIATGTTVKFNDIACTWDSSTCLVVANGGYAFRIKDATGASPQVENISARLGITQSTKDLLGAGVSNATWYIGVHNTILKSFDSGDAWTVIPLNYVQSDTVRFSIYPDDRGFGYGGNATAPRFFTFQDHKLSSQLYLRHLNASLAEDAKITSVNIHCECNPSSNATFSAQASSNGGNNWQPLGPLQDIKTTRYDNGMLVAYVENVREGNIASGAQGRDLRLRFTLTTSSTVTHQTAYIQTVHVNYTVSVGGGPPTTYYTSVNMADPAHKTAYLDTANNTADWNATLGAAHTPRVIDGWVRNVSGEVTDVLSGYNVASDWRDEVWVATGAVLAGNSPEYAIYASSNESMAVGKDYRIYLLDGKNGTVINKTVPLPGKVTEIGMVDRDLNGVPDMLMATVVEDDGASMHIYGFGPTNLTEVLNKTFTLSSPYDMLVTNGPGPYGHVFSAVKGVDVGTGGVTASKMHKINETNITEWTSLPDDRGKYTIAQDIPRGWLFGPYAVELTVAWTERTTIANVTTDVLQSASFYDYFMVTPPDALSPPSPVYNVELQTWLRDWR